MKLAGLLPLLLCAGAASAAPPDGHYEATLCVAVAAAPANCGPVAVELIQGNQALVSVADITYQLWQYPSRLSVVLMHGSMQIHEFYSAYAWQGHTLQFADVDKGVRYELRLSNP